MKRATRQIFLISVVLSATWPASAANENAPLSGTAANASAAAAPSSLTATTQSSASAPLRQSSPLLQQTVVKESAPALQDNSVESFFQVGQSQRNSRQNLLMQAAVVKALPDNNSSKWREHGYSRALWHFLDNISIPMFWGQDPDYIDPSIKETYLIPSPMLPGRRGLADLEETPIRIGQPPLQSAAAQRLLENQVFHPRIATNHTSRQRLMPQRLFQHATRVILLTYAPHRRCWLHLPGQNRCQRHPAPPA